MPIKKNKMVVRWSANFRRRMSTPDMPRKMSDVVVVSSPPMSSPKKPSAKVITMYVFSGMCYYAGALEK